MTSTTSGHWWPRGWLPARVAAGRRGFGVRLFVALAVTLVAIGGVGYVLMARQLRHGQIAEYERTLQADARSFEAIDQLAPTLKLAIAKVDGALDVIAKRPGTLETLLIDPRSIVVASGNQEHVVGTRDSDAGIVKALRDGTSYAGGETDPRRDHTNFEFITPLELGTGRYVLEIGYDHGVLDADLADIRNTLAIIGLLALLGGGAVFYLAGGRNLLRSHRQALHRGTRDGLTDLSNHRAFQDEFPSAVSAATRYEQPLSIIVLDLDDFKFLNDSYGHPHGDDVLNRVAHVLRGGRAEDRAYRIGGDEFALLLPHTDGEGARRIAARMRKALEAAEVVVSIGISDLRGGQSAEDLRAEADAALYEAKRRGGGRVAHFDEIRDDVVIATSGRTDLVRALIDEARLSTVYQPIWDLESDRLLGVEALMRPDPELGLSGPEEAFDLAERIGRVHDLDVLAVGHALRDVPVLPDGALLFLNLTPHTLDLDARGSDWLLEAVSAAGLTTNQVVVEVTERFGARTDAVVDCLEGLRSDGFRVALDDVGTGNSGLEMLRRVSADYVKSDRSIVLGAATDRNARAVLMAMATYARQTGSYVIAEGIENQETLEFLAAIDERDIRPERIIQGGQGYGLGRPAPSGALDGRRRRRDQPIDVLAV